MSDSEAMGWQVNVERFTGFAGLYHQYRPSLPVIVLDVVSRLAQIAPAELVVDLGCGTGLSTRAWAGRAREVIGIEPSDDMRRQAQSMTVEPNVHYREGFGHATGVPDARADIVTCSQSLHWMEPAGTFAEAARILRPGGVFAAIDYDWPPTLPDWRAEEAYRQFSAGVHELGQRERIEQGLRRWGKSGHLQRMTASGAFRFTKEIVLHSTELGDGARLVGMALSLGGVETLLKKGISQDELGLTALRERLAELLPQQQTWVFSYRLRVGIH